MAETAQLGPQQVIRGANPPDQVDGRGNIPGPGAVDFHRVAAQAANLRAHIAENLQQQPNVGDIGHIFNVALAGYQQRGGQNRHGGVFGSGDGDVAVEGLSALNDIFYQEKSLIFRKSEAADGGACLTLFYEKYGPGGRKIPVLSFTRSIIAQNPRYVKRNITKEMQIGYKWFHLVAEAPKGPQI